MLSLKGGLPELDFGVFFGSCYHRGPLTRPQPAAFASEAFARNPPLHASAPPQKGDHGSPRFLITRLSAIGDCILTMPLAVALREAFPTAYIAWAVEGVAGTMIERHPAVDQAIRLPRGFARSAAAWRQLRRQLRSLCFDVAIDPQSLTKSALVAWISGAPRRIGFARPVGRELAPWLHTELVASRVAHVVDRYCELLTPLNAAAGPIRFDFPITADAETDVGKHLEGLAAPVAVINPGAGWESKRWPQERFAEVARELYRRHQVRSLVVWAGPQELAWAQEIAAAGDGWSTVAPPTTLLELAALLRKATLFVGSDTGPLHMAAAVGLPCVGIYGPTRPENCGPYGQGHQVVQAWYQDGSSRQRRRGPNSAMRDVPVSWVVEACERILARNRSQTAA